MKCVFYLKSACTVPHLSRAHVIQQGNCSVNLSHTGRRSIVL